METLQNRRSSVSSAVAERQAMAAASSSSLGDSNGHGNLRANKRPALSNITNYSTGYSSKFVKLVGSGSFSKGSIDADVPIRSKSIDADVPRIPPDVQRIPPVTRSMDMELGNKIVNIDNNFVDIYKHLRASEAKKRPSTEYMVKVQKHINSSMRAYLIDWLVKVAEHYGLVPQTLYLTVNYIDRYLSAISMDAKRLQLLGVACMMIAAKYEEIYPPQVKDFCYITNNTYSKDEVLQMESSVLHHLKFEMTAPTVICFLRRSLRAAQGFNKALMFQRKSIVNLGFPQALSLQLEHLASYIAELSLLEYNMLCYAPSLIAASAVSLAKYILLPSEKPWSSTLRLRHYTLYQPSDLKDCVMALHSLRYNDNSSPLTAIREKYSQKKFKCVATKNCPPTLPAELFQNTS